MKINATVAFIELLGCIKKNILKSQFYIVIALLLISCNRSHQEDKATGPSLTNYFFETLDSTERRLEFTIENKDVVFIDATDYEPTLYERVTFDIDPTLDSFRLKNDELKSINSKYSWLIATKRPERKTTNITVGEISGHKIDSTTWKVSVDIDSKQNVDKSLNSGSRKIKTTETIKKTQPNKT